MFDDPLASEVSFFRAILILFTASVFCWVWRELIREQVLQRVSRENIRVKCAVSQYTGGRDAWPGCRWE